MSEQRRMGKSDLARSAARIGSSLISAAPKRTARMGVRNGGKNAPR